MVKRLQLDWILFAAAAALSLFGVVMVYSASAMLAIKETGGANEYGYVLKQAAFTIAGLFIMLAMTKFDYRWLKQGWLIAAILIVTLCLLGAVLFFPPVNGARRWIKFGGLSIQASELAKPALALFLAFFFSKRTVDEMRDLKFTFLPCAVIVGALLTLIMLEPDLGTAMVLAATFITVYFAAGASLKHFAIAAGIFVTGALAALILVPWRMQRLLAYRDPWADPENSGYQLIQSLIAVGSGGTSGVGLFNSQQKMHYLPFAHSDFIFAIVCEELGLIGALIILSGFGLILVRGARTAMTAPDKFGKLLSIGLLTSVIVQAFFNMSVVIGLLPTKGIPLPFISYGGSSILVTLFSMGLLLNISQYSGVKDASEE